MGEKAKYKSAIRSKKMIRYAFIELALEKECEKITVKNIVERAEISRGTFYAHYTDIYAVIEEIENETMEKILEFLNDFKGADILKNPLPLLKKVSSFFEQDIDFYRMVINTQGAPNFIFKLKEAVIENILSGKKKSKTTHDPNEYKMYVYRVHFFVGGITSMYQDWFAGKFNGTLEDLTKAFGQITIQGFQSK